MPWFPESPCSQAPTSVATAWPGEAGGKRHSFTEIRGLQVCWWPVPSVTRLWCILLSLGSTVTAMHCIQTPLGRPRQQLTALRLGVPRAASPHSLRLHLRAALCAAGLADATASSCPYPRGTGTHGLLGLGSLDLHPTSATSHSWTTDVVPKPSDPRVSHLHGEVSGGGGSPGGHREVWKRCWVWRKRPANWSHYYYSLFPLPHFSVQQGASYFITLSSASFTFAFGFGSGSSKSK